MPFLGEFKKPQERHTGCSLRVLSGKQISDFAAEGRSGIAVAHDDEYGIIARQGTQHHTHIHGIHGGGGSAGQAGHGFDDDHVLGVVKAGDALPEYGIQPGGEGMIPILGGGACGVP